METENYFHYSGEVINHLKTNDKKLAQVIEELGMLKRRVRPDLFSALMRTIIGQQISTKAQATVWQRVVTSLTEVTPHSIAHINADELQQLGLSHRKVGYMQDTAHKILNGDFDLEALKYMSDDDVTKQLVTLRGIGQWSAEMLMIFSLGRPNILSFGDLAILRGIRMLYGHSEITPEIFRMYQQQYAPYSSVASLYLWAVAGGASKGLTDPASNNKSSSPKTKKSVNKTKQSTNTTRQSLSQQSKPLQTQKDESNQSLYKDIYSSTLGDLVVFATDHHVTLVQFVHNDEEAYNNIIVYPNSLTNKAIEQLAEYFAGTRQQFELPLQQQGTEFQQRVWETLITLDYGTTASYKEVATLVGNAKASRAVGMANNRNRIAIIVPCHRVVGSNGKLVGYVGGLAIKEQLLALEQAQG